jgi:hypothetical protein
VHRRHNYPRQSVGSWGRPGTEGEPEDHCLGRSRGGYSTKLHLLTDVNGIPLALLLTAGQRHKADHLGRQFTHDGALPARVRGRQTSRPMSKFRQRATWSGGLPQARR